MRIESSLALKRDYENDAMSTPFSGTGCSPDAEELKNILLEIYKSYKKSEDIRKLQTTIQYLNEIFEACSMSNWNNQSAKPISREAYLEARRVIGQIRQYHLPMPDDIIPEPSGAIGLEWQTDKHKFFIISVKGKKIINYAGKFGHENIVHGKESFDEFHFILRSLRRLYEEWN